jgi:iron complex transport system substrate-binding protein
VLLLILVCLVCRLPAQGAERVVSLNLCTDQWVVLLAPEKVAALSPLARDPTLSYVAAAAANLPAVRASAEAVLRLHPDLVLAAPYGAQTTLAILAQERIPLLRIDLPHDFAGIRDLTRQLAGALGVPERGEVLVTSMDATLVTLPQPDRQGRAIVWEPRGLTEGPDTLMDAVLHAAGFMNAANGRRMGLEALLRHPPDLLVLPTTPVFPSLATALLQHPALAVLPRRTLPAALTICAGPFTAEAAAMLTR